MISLIYPICNRTFLFRNTLHKLATQEYKDYEILVIDDGGTDPDLRPMLHNYAERAKLRIRYLKINVFNLPYPVYRYGLFNNPAPAWNVGIRRAQSNRVVLSSPEVLPLTNTVLTELANLPEEPAWICNVYDPDLGWIGGGPSRRPYHFLAMFQKDILEDLGGFEERFISGWAWEDTEFQARFIRKHGYSWSFTGSQVEAFHQRHERVEFSDRTGWSINEQLYNALITDPSYIRANPGHDWGGEALVEEDLWL